MATLPDFLHRINREQDQKLQHRRAVLEATKFLVRSFNHQQTKAVTGVEREAQIFVAARDAVDAVARRFGVDPLYLAEALRDGGLLELIEVPAHQRAGNGGTTARCANAAGEAAAVKGVQFRDRDGDGAPRLAGISARKDCLRRRRRGRTLS